MIPTTFGCNVSVAIVRDIQSDTATVHVHAPLYMNKHWIMPHSYRASQFSDHDIIRDSDFISVMCNHYPN